MVARKVSTGQPIFSASSSSVSAIRVFPLATSLSTVSFTSSSAKGWPIEAIMVSQNMPPPVPPSRDCRL